MASGLLSGPSYATVNHLVFGLSPDSGFDVSQDGVTIHQGIQASPIGSLVFAVDGGGTFAIHTADESNPPPGRVTDLDSVSSTQTSLTLTWTAVGSDSVAGQASVYDLRYAITPITSSSWNSATQVEGEGVPLPAGQTESLTVANLTAATTYYFALRVGDEIPHWSVISNVASGATLPPPDTTAPAAVANLSAGSPATDSIRLTWTAVGDDGMSGRATTYDIRYAIAPITSTSWDVAAKVTSEPAPGTAGVSQALTIPGLASDTVYYFAMKVADEVPNWSGLSNTASARTLSPPDTMPPSDVTDLEAGSQTSESIRLTWTAVGDDGMTGRASVYDIRYSTSTITSANWGSATQAGGEPAPGVHGVPESFVLASLQPGRRYFFAIRVRDESMNWSGISNVPSARTQPAPDTAPPKTIDDLGRGAVGHREIEITWTAPSDDSLSERATLYEGRCTTGPLTVSTWATATPIAQMPDPAQPGESQRLVIDGLTPATVYSIGIRARDEMGHLASLGTVLRIATTSAPDTLSPGRITDLRIMGQTISTITIRWSAPADRIPEDCVEIPEVDRYEIRFSTASLEGAGWEAGTALPGSPPGPPGATEEVTITGLLPARRYFVALRACDPRNRCSEISNEVEQSTAEPEPLPDTIPPGPPLDLVAAVQDTQSILLTWLAPGGDGSQGAADHYEIRSSGEPVTPETWNLATPVTIDKACGPAGSRESHLVDRLAPATIYHFALRAIDHAGNPGPISSSASDTTVAPPDPADRSAPEAVVDLRIVDADTVSIVLSWTTPGDDRGGCAGYELRRSPAAIDLSSWETALPVDGLPSPGEPGSPASFRVRDLSPGTSHFFALRASDAAGNRSDISNVVSARTDTIPIPPDTTPPPAVVDLAATPLGSSRILLTWTAVGDAGPPDSARHYEVRFSTVPIDATSWGLATEVPVPFEAGPPGSSESLQVEGLLPATTYHFTVRVRDGDGNLSDCSPDVSAVTPPIPDTSPPAAPLGLEAAADADRVHLTWSPSPEPDVVVYVLFRRGTEGSGVEPLSIPGLHALVFEDTTALPQIDYYYSIAAVDGSGNRSTPSAEILVRLPIEGFLPQLAGFSAEASATPIGPGEGSRVRVSWQAAPGDRFLEFAVDRSDDGGANWSRRATGSFPAKVGYEFEEEVAPGTYVYRIAAISTLGYETAFQPVTVDARGWPAVTLIDGPFPNPSTGPFQLAITLVSNARVRVLAYDIQGRLCALLHDGLERAGTLAWTYAPRSNEAAPLQPGVYFLRILVGEEQIVRKLVLRG